MAAKALEVRHPAFHGLINAQCAVTGSAAVPQLSGDLKVSRGSVIASGTFPQARFSPATMPLSQYEPLCFLLFLPCPC